MATMVIRMMRRMCFLLFRDARDPKYRGRDEPGAKMCSTYVPTGFAYVENLNFVTLGVHPGLEQLGIG